MHLLNSSSNSRHSHLNLSLTADPKELITTYYSCILQIPANLRKTSTVFCSQICNLPISTFVESFQPSWECTVLGHHWKNKPWSQMNWFFLPFMSFWSNVLHWMPALWNPTFSHLTSYDTDGRLYSDPYLSTWITKCLFCFSVAGITVRQMIW